MSRAGSMLRPSVVFLPGGGVEGTTQLLVWYAEPIQIVWRLQCKMWQDG